MTILLADVGGTHVRFALKGATANPGKFLAADFADLSDAITAFLQSAQILPENVTAFYLAFSNRNSWLTDAASLRVALPTARIHQVNDFEANAHGILRSPADDFVPLHDPGLRRDDVRAVIGVGTGLGLAYIHDVDGCAYVHKTHGGHMHPAWSQPHNSIFADFAARKTGALIYEDILSGQGLFNLYAYISAKGQLDAEYADAATLMRDGRDNPVFQEAATVFFEILGLFAHHVLAFGHAYGGLYLTGGVIDRLMHAGLFDTAAFRRGLYHDHVKVVRDDVENTPVFWIKNEFVSLKGLEQLALKDGTDA